MEEGNLPNGGETAVAVRVKKLR